MATPLLNITELASGQVDQYVTANEAFRLLEAAMAGRLTVDLSSDANYTLVTTAGSEEWRDKFLTITDSGTALTTGRDIVFPDEDGPEYIFTNDTAQTLTCKLSGQTGVAVSAGATVRLFNDGTDMVTGP